MSTCNLPTCNSFTSHHFHLERLADGVYAAINSDEGWAICNASIIDLGDRTLVYDSFTSPQAASDLRDAAEYLTGRPARDEYSGLVQVTICIKIIEYINLNLLMKVNASVKIQAILAWRKKYGTGSEIEPAG